MKAPISLPERMTLSDEIKRKMLDQFSARLRVACPGIIQSFDADKQTVEVILSIKEDIVIDGKLEKGVAVPLLVDVPILMPRAGNFVLTVPVHLGDECLVVFGDACIDAWWQSGSVQNQIDKRRHDLSDGFAILGPWSQGRVLPNYKTNATQLRDIAGNNYVEITEAEEVNIVSTEKIYENSKEVEIVGLEKVTINGASEVNIISATKVVVTAPVIQANGATTITGPTVITGGSITLSPSSGTSLIDGKNFLSHTHTAPDGGGLTTGVT